MLKKVLLILAFLGLSAFTAATPGVAADPPAEQGATEPEDPDAAPYPPDGVTDPNADYPVDGSEGTDQGEPGAGADPAPQPAPAPATKAPQ
jgi:hypothetical protein